MTGTTPVVIVTRKLPDGVERELAARFHAELNASDTPMNAEVLKAAVARAGVLVPTVTDRIGPEIIAAAGPQLKLIANFGVGFNHIDVKAASARGIAVTNTPGVLTDATADIGMTLMLMVTRRAVEGSNLLHAGQFPGWCPTWLMGVSLRGKTLGIVGMGRIGEAMGLRASAFGMAIHYHNRKRVAPETENALGATYWPDLDAMLGAMDIVSIHAPYTPQTYHLFSAERIARMKPSAYLINTARGEIVDEAALADALASGRLAGAGLDVFEHEPKVHPTLLGLTNVALLPHLGSSTIEARTGMGNKVIA
ncbi:MAG TPA: D-glycerate dehydrogenase, partial [Micropepsaceae bacterium]